jgi:hypothetical protein
MALVAATMVVLEGASVNGNARRSHRRRGERVGGRSIWLSGWFLRPLAWLTDVLERMVSGRTKAHELARLLPWAWKAERLAAAVNA